MFTSAYGIRWGCALGLAVGLLVLVPQRSLAQAQPSQAEIAAVMAYLQECQNAAARQQALAQLALCNCGNSPTSGGRLTPTPAARASTPTPRIMTPMPARPVPQHAQVARSTQPAARGPLHTAGTCARGPLHTAGTRSRGTLHTTRARGTLQPARACVPFHAAWAAAQPKHGISSGQSGCSSDSQHRLGAEQSAGASIHS